MKIEYMLKKALKSNNKDELNYVFELIYQKYHKLIYYIIIRIIKEHELTEELVNDTFLKVFNNIHNYKIGSNLKAWTVVIAKNLAINEYNKRKKSSLELNEEYVLNTPCNNKNYFELIKDFKRYLSDDEINIIILRIFYDFKFKEIADYVGSTTAAVANKYLRAINKLKKEFKKGEI